jgi:hypothetical protein
VERSEKKERGGGGWVSGEEGAVSGEKGLGLVIIGWVVNESFLFSVICSKPWKIS